MILLDANLLIAAVTDRPERQAAAAWLEQQLWEAPKVGMPWESLLAFVRVVTNPRIHSIRVSIDDAWGQVEEWLSCDAVWTPAPTERHPGVLRQLLVKTRAYGDLVPDAHLAAIAIEHGLTVYSLDADFGRFPGVSWVNPLAPK